MEVMQQLRMEVSGKAKATEKAVHNLKDDLEEVVEEALLKRRSRADRTVSDGSTLTTVSSTASETSTTTTSSSSSGEYFLETVIHEEEAAAGGGGGKSSDKKPQDSVYFENCEGTDTGIKVNDFDIQQIMGSVIDAKQFETSKVDKVSTSAAPSRKQVGTAANYELVDESDEDVVELEFETAVETMHAHDDYSMFCPNCSSRITKVVLRRKIRRRKIPSDRRDLFGCASCFSIFVSCGNRLNPFRIFRAEPDVEENNQLQEQPASDARVPTSDPVQSTGSGCNPLWLFRKERDDTNELTSPLLTEAETQESSAITVTQKPRDEAIEQNKGYDFFWLFGKGRDYKNALSSTVLASAQIQSSSAPAISYTPRDEGGIQQQSKDGDSTETLVDQVPTTSTKSTTTTSTTTTTTTVAVGQQTIEKTENNISVASVGQQTIEKTENNIIVTSVGNSILQIAPQQGYANGNVIIDVDKQDGEVIIPFVEAPPPTVIQQSAVTAATVAQPLIVSEPGSSRSLEIVKSIVYGGLMESIASVSIVSSAAASEATTLNIVVLGFANLVGGLVVLAHNLKDLRYGENGQTNEQKYGEELGRKENFTLHATFAVLSYIIFGLIPPVTYGFSFRENNDRDNKMLAVAAASLLCILILAIAKAYTRGEHKFMTYFKTVSYYITTAVAASGIAFAVGDLAKKFLDKYGWLDPATVQPEPSSFRSTWSSY